ncbi:MAG TPA: glycerophosphoryl diester phosphodiesterase membrane domain-containing protein [Verrucomicrobiae bacterium]|nr:glycerophosphoryl diester phosphodiesterase membrane domain-containing protein [Verrucomicrobiae bacterium]
MATYTIIGGDGKEYGPVSESEVRKWISEGRLNAQSLMKAESDAEFRTLDKFPEFADALGIFTATSDAPPPFPTPAVFVERDYELDIGGCIGHGWDLLKNNFSVVFVGTLIYLLIEFAVGMVAQIPLIGPFIQIANFVISGPLMGGLLYLFIRVIRKEPATAGDVFSGFQRAFGQLFLGTLVQGLLIGLCMVPFIIIFVIKFIPLIGHLEPHGAPPSAEVLAALKSMLLTSLPVFLICLIPAMFLAVNWKFTLPLIVDKKMDFWTAMKTSWKMVMKHWWLVFGLIILISLINSLGFLACCVGVLFTMPIGLGALMYAYETIFCQSQNT